MDAQPQSKQPLFRPDAPADIPRLVVVGDAVEHLEAIAQPSAFVCPDCKGGLWQVDGSAPVRYRCHGLDTQARRLRELVEKPN